MKANQVRPGVLAFEIEKGDQRRVTAEALRSRGWGPDALRLVAGRQTRRVAAVPESQPTEDAVVPSDDSKP